MTPGTASGRSAGSTADASRTSSASKPPVREGEKPWTAAELRAIRAEIESDIASLTRDIAVHDSELAGLMRDSGDGSGDDEADAGTKTYEREQEMTVGANSRDLLQQNQRALERLEDGTYGRCENCGQPIGKLRLQAAPRATLCLDCKRLEERR